MKKGPLGALISDQNASPFRSSRSITNGTID